MKTYSLKTLLLPALLLLAACTADDDGAAPTAPPRTAVLGVGSVSVQGSGAATRAGGDITSGKLWVGVRAANDYPMATNIIYEYKSGSGWYQSPLNPVLLNTQDISLYAYHPQDKFSLGGGAIIQFSSRQYNADYDLCFATAAASPVNADNPKARFEMKHAYARITLAITLDPKLTTAANISELTLASANLLDGIYTEGSVGVRTGTIDPVIKGTYTSIKKTTVTAGTTNTAYDILFVAQDVPADGIKITLTIDGRERSVVIPQSSFANNKLENNKQYTIRLEIQPFANLVPVAGGVTEEEWAKPTDGKDFGGAVDDSNTNPTS